MIRKMGFELPESIDRGVNQNRFVLCIEVILLRQLWGKEDVVNQVLNSPKGETVTERCHGKCDGDKQIDLAGRERRARRCQRKVFGDLISRRACKRFRKKQRIVIAARQQILLQRTKDSKAGDDREW